MSDDKPGLDEPLPPAALDDPHLQPSTKNPSGCRLLAVLAMVVGMSVRRLHLGLLGRRLQRVGGRHARRRHVRPGHRDHRLGQVPHAPGAVRRGAPRVPLDRARRGRSTPPSPAGEASRSSAGVSCSASSPWPGIMTLALVVPGVRSLGPKPAKSEENEGPPTTRSSPPTGRRAPSWPPSTAGWSGRRPRGRRRADRLPQGFEGSSPDQVILIRLAELSRASSSRWVPPADRMGVAGLRGLLQALHPPRAARSASTRSAPSSWCAPATSRSSTSTPAAFPSSAPHPARCHSFRSRSTRRPDAGQRRLRPGRRPRILGAPMIDKILNWVDDRLGVAKGGRTFLDKIFPDHWSFMLGEIALYSFVVLLGTGVFLTLYYVPSAHEIVYHGSYVPLRGQRVSEAYASTVGLSFDVRSGLLMRQAHHWAADIFLGSIAVHMARVFFTGAFRKPREFNWIVGVTMLILGIVNGFLGYSLPDDLVSGTGIRIAYSIIESIPVVGTYLGFFLFGGNYPGRGDHPPVLHHPRADRAGHPGRTPRRPPRPAGQTEAHPVPGEGQDRGQRGRLADVPHLHGQDHRLPVHVVRRHLPARRIRPDQPDLAVRPVRALPDLLRRPARLVHGLARRGAADHAELGVGRLGAHPAARGLPARRDLPGADLHHPDGLAADRVGQDEGLDYHNLLDRPATVPSGRRPVRPC